MQRLKAAGRVVKSRRLLFLLVFAALTIGLIATVNAVSEDDVFDGQAAPGDHEWWMTLVMPLSVRVVTRPSRPTLPLAPT